MKEIRCNMQGGEACGIYNSTSSIFVAWQMFLTDGEPALDVAVIQYNNRSQLGLAAELFFSTK